LATLIFELAGIQVELIWPITVVPTRIEHDKSLVVATPRRSEASLVSNE
jgi:hypothetical protein